MKDQTIGIILAHGAVRNTCERHEPHWLNTCKKLFYFSPTDDNVSLPGRHEYSVGKSAAYSAHTNHRTREALRFASLLPCKWIALYEYDSILFGDFPETLLKENADVYAPQFHDPENPQFKGKYYLHFPQFYRRVHLEKLVNALDSIPLDAEKGFTDRLIGYGVSLTDMKVRDMNNTGLVYTQNHIDKIKLPEALAAYAKGCRWSHGIKDVDTFEALKKASALYTFNEGEPK